MDLLPRAWIVAGDFNCICIRYQDKKLGGNLVPGRKLSHFNNFIEAEALSDLKVSGASWTWINKQEARLIACKLDIILVNDEWLEVYPNASAATGNSLLSNHTPILLNLKPNNLSKRKSFTYFNHWKNIQGYEEAVQRGWKVNIPGNPTFQLTVKLKKVRQELQAWCKKNDLSNPAKARKEAKENLIQI